MQSDILDVVIGLVFVWFLLSVALSAVNEGLALLTRVRAKHLWLGVGRLLDPSKGILPKTLVDAAIRVPLGRADVRPNAFGEAGTGPWARFVARIGTMWHGVTTPLAGPRSGGLDDLRPRVEALYAELAPHVAEVAKAGRRSKVTRIAATLISDAVATLARHVHPGDLVATAREAQWSAEAIRSLEALVAPEDGARTLSPEAVVAWAGPGTALSAEKLRQLYDEAATRFTGRDVADYFEQNPQLAEAVRRAAAAVASDRRVLAVKTTVEQWFEREMDQLTALYRRQNRKIMAILAVPAVLLLQANTVKVVQDLRDDANLRAAVASSAISAAAASSLGDAVTCKTSSATTSSTTSSTTTTTTTTTTATTADPVTQAVDKFKCAAIIIGQSKKFGYGLGWDGVHVFDDYGWIGRPITWLALLFGAQFWFDVLRRLVGLRGGASSPRATTAETTA